jgi:hypothetical protein
MKRGLLVAAFIMATLLVAVARPGSSQALECDRRLLEARQLARIESTASFVKDMSDTDRLIQSCGSEATAARVLAWTVATGVQRIREIADSHWTITTDRIAMGPLNHITESLRGIDRLTTRQHIMVRVLVIHGDLDDIREECVAGQPPSRR